MLLWTFNWNCPPNMEVKIFLLNKKLFILCNELKKRFAEINSWAVHLSGPCCKIRSRRRETIRILLFIAHPVQLYNNWSIHYLVKLFSMDHYSRWPRSAHPSSMQDTCHIWRGALGYIRNRKTEGKNHPKPQNRQKIRPKPKTAYKTVKNGYNGDKWGI